MKDRFPRSTHYTILERRGCNKACYPSESAAKRSVRSLDRNGHANHWKGNLRPYLCRPCRAWHVGHSDSQGDD